MSRTRLQIRQLVAQQFPLEFISGTTTSSDAATMTDLPVLGKFANNHFIGAHVFHADATVTDRVVTDSVQSTGVLTYIVSDNNGKDGTDSYEILPYSGTAIHQAIDDSLIEAYDRGVLSERVWLTHWLAGSPIYNATFDYWTSTTQPAGWTLATATASQKSWLAASDPAVPGRLAVKLAGSSGTLTLSEDYHRYLLDLRGHTVTFHMFAQAAAADDLNLQVTVDGTTTTSSNVASGARPEIVDLEVTIPETARVIVPRANVVAGGGDKYVGAIWVENGPRIREYPWPSDLAPDGPDAIYSIPVNIRDDPNGTPIANIIHGGRYKALDKWQIYTFDEDPGIGTRREGSLIFHGDTPTPGHRLWMPTRIPFTLPTSDTSNIAVSNEDSLLIAKMAALKLIEADMFGLNTAAQTRLTQFAGRLQSHITDLSKGRGEHKTVRPLGRGW